jgi:dUTP pyrophosphatase
LKLKIKKIHQKDMPEPITPTYATDGSGCFDIYAYCPNASINMYSNTTAFFDTKLEFEIPEGYAMKVYSRSGHGFKHNVSLVNGTGIIDSDYRGEVKVGLVAGLTTDPLRVKHGDRIAQAMLVPVEQVEFEVVQKLSDTKRGKGGFGHSGN